MWYNVHLQNCGNVVATLSQRWASAGISSRWADGHAILDITLHIQDHPGEHACMRMHTHACACARTHLKHAQKRKNWWVFVLLPNIYWISKTGHNINIGGRVLIISKIIHKLVHWGLIQNKNLAPSVAPFELDSRSLKRWGRGDVDLVWIIATLFTHEI